jgi:hypothetical protein
MAASCGVRLNRRVLEAEPGTPSQAGGPVDDQVRVLLGRFGFGITSLNDQFAMIIGSPGAGYGGSGRY